MQARFLLPAVAFALAFAQGEPHSTILIKVSHVAAADTPEGQAAESVKKRAEEPTAGRVRLEVHPSSTLYEDREEIEALELGAVQMLAPSLSKLGPLGAKELEVFDLPFILDDHADLGRVTEGPVGKRLLEALESGIRGLAYWDNGPVAGAAPRGARRRTP